MRVTINGEVRDLENCGTLAAFLEDSGLSAKNVVVERNGEIVPGGEFSLVEFEEGDVLEVLRFVGGG